MTPTDERSRLRQWQGGTIGLLFIGYMGYYVCRSVLPVASPQLPLDNKDYGRLGAIGIYLYAIGKLTNGVATEYFGGRRMFLLGMFGSIGCVVVFAFGDRILPGSVFLAFALAWGANRFVQSMGWGGLVQIAGRWFHPKSLATVMGVLSLSYLFGDALAKLYLGAFGMAGFGWRELFLLAAGTLLVIGILNAIFLKGRPAEVGLPEPPPSALNVHGNDAGEGRIPLGKLLGPLLRSRMFWLVCLMNAGLTCVRETFNFWIPRYLDKGLHVEARLAGLLSFVFPLAGAVAALGAGYTVDRLGQRYGRVMLPLLLLSAVMLAGFLVVDLTGKPLLALALVAGVALCVTGPYTFCSGVLAVNLGGKRAAAASAGLIDAAGYICAAVVSGELAGRLVIVHSPDHHDYTPVFKMLLGITVATFAVTFAFWFFEERLRRRVKIGS